VGLHNESIRRDIDGLHQEIAYNHDVKKKQQNGIFQLKGDQRGREKDVEDQKLRLQVLDREERQLNDRIRTLTDAIDQKVTAIEKTGGKLELTVREVEQVKGAVASLDYQAQDVSRSNAQAIELQKRLFRQKDAEVLKNQDIDKAVRITDQNIKDMELHIDGLNQDLESMRYSNEALVERNYDLRQNLESLNRHQRLLTEQNNELQRELDGFIETDEIVKRNLDRKDKVQSIRSQVDEVIKRSMMEVRSRSPIRGGTQQH
jgi:chromosome segregation ATPase